MQPNINHHRHMSCVHMKLRILQPQPAFDEPERICIVTLGGPFCLAGVPRGCRFSPLQDPRIRDTGAFRDSQQLRSH